MSTLDDLAATVAAARASAVAAEVHAANLRHAAHEAEDAFRAAVLALARSHPAPFVVAANGRHWLVRITRYEGDVNHPKAVWAMDPIDVVAS